MPWSKFRPLKQFGKENVRIFKGILEARNKRPLGQLEPPEFTSFLQETGTKVYDPLEPGFFEENQNEQLQFAQKPAHLRKLGRMEHPLYKAEKCLLFEGKIPLSDGVDQACALIKAPEAQPFPPGFFDQNFPEEAFPENFGEQVADAIMHGERYDATFEKLPRRFDPILFWIRHPNSYGTPVPKRSNIILSDLCRKVYMLAGSKDKTYISDLRFDYNAPISGYLPAPFSGLEHPFVLRQQPFLTIQHNEPLSLLADDSMVQATREMEVPDLYPISAQIDLEQESIYNDNALVPRQFQPSLSIHTICASRGITSLQDQKYPWTTDQNAGNAILNGFGAALAHITREGFEDHSSSDALPRPTLIKSLQIANGKIDFVMVQVNTLNLQTNRGANDVKNLVWLEKAAPLYTPKPYWENMDEVRDLNYETVKKFISFMLYR